jgi:hypothetical protein
MKMKTSELKDAALDWAVEVAKCEEPELTIETFKPEWERYNYAASIDWAQGGPIIEREKIMIKENGFGHWFARIGKSKWMRGPTPLIAAMRCFVFSRLGEEVEIPEELK